MKVLFILIFLISFLFSSNSPTLEDWNNFPKGKFEKMLKENGTSKTLKEMSNGLNSLISENDGEIKIDNTTSVVSSHIRGDTLILKNVVNKELYVKKLKSNINNVFSEEQINDTLNNIELKKELVNEIETVNINSFCSNKIYRILIDNNVLIEFIFHFDNGEILGNFVIDKKDCENIVIGESEESKDISFEDFKLDNSEYYNKIINYSNGKIKSKQTVKNGKLNGKFIQYYENDNIHHECIYKDNKLNGYYKEYYDNNKIHASENYINGVPNGKFTYYYKNGNLKSDAFYENGKFEGIQKEYYENGSIKNIWNYQKGVLNGHATKYYENGNKKSEANITNGKLEGVVKTYNFKGEIEEEKTYKNNIYMD